MLKDYAFEVEQLLQINCGSLITCDSLLGLEDVILISAKWFLIAIHMLMEKPSC